MRGSVSNRKSTIGIWQFQKLPRSFYLRPTVQVARDLLGKYVVRKYRGKRLVGKIVEVEAYLGSKDQASHAYRGMTKRNEVMFWKGGQLYVYFTYGMHFCANVVTREEGIGEAVLIRAVEPIEGIELMRKNRSIGASGQRGIGESMAKALSRGDEGQGSRGELVKLTNGPAKFCEAFGIARRENGTDLLGDDIYITNGETIPSSRIGRSTRIGIRNGKEKQWRFFINVSRWVSRG